MTSSEIPPLKDAGSLDGFELVHVVRFEGGVWQSYKATTQYFVNLASTGDVESVFGRTGVVTAEVGDYSAFYSQLGHDHDDRYYTESEIDTALALKSDSGHNHDDRYYTETEVDTALATKSDTSHLHDDRYYTEGETDALLANKSDIGHLHDDRYYTEGEVDAAFAAHEITIANHDDVTFTVLTDNDFIQRKAGGWVNRTPAQVAADLNHDLLAGFVVDEHIAHSGVVFTAGAGLTGGGDISASRSFDVGAGTGITVAADAVAFDTTFGDARYALVSHTHTLSDITDAGAAAAAGVKNSVEINLGDIQLVGDEAAPTADKYYGTDSLGARGFHTLPSGGGGAVDSVFGRTGAVVATAGDYTATQVTYDNTVSGLVATDVQAAIDEVEAHAGRTDNPHAVTKSQVGLGSVDNVSAANLRDRATHTGTEPASAFATGPGVVTPAMLNNANPTTILGRSASSTGPRADIAAAANDTLLRRVADALDFGQLTLGMISDGLITNIKLGTMGGGLLKGRLTGSGPPEDLGGSTVKNMLSLDLVPNFAAASQLEAESGTANDKLMTPLRSRQHGDARYALLTSGFVLGSRQIFTTNGTWTKPAGCRAVRVRVVGGGGGGRGPAAASGGGGGGAGGYSEKFITSGLGATETVTVGTGGNGGAAGGNNGNNGNASSFGAHCSANGGGGAGATGGVGGTATGGDFNVTGSAGNSRTDAASTPFGGNGGVSVFGGAGGGTTGAGGDGTTGSGGAGGASNTAGGNGGNGIVIIEELY